MSRQFGETIPENAQSSIKTQNSKEFFTWMQNNEIGKDEVIETPFGKRQILYCDYSASARAFAPIEEYIVSEVLPLYGNSHSSVTVTAEQTTLFVHEARQEIRAMTGAGDNDAVVFTGTGSTAAVELFFHLMDIGNDLIVVHSDMEHHSNLLPWRQAASKCFAISNKDGLVDLDSLTSTLDIVSVNFPERSIVCTFTACSNLTGICTNVEVLARICKEKCPSAIVVFDFASAASCVDINVNGSFPLDAVFFSGHKFIGGVSTPGVLVVKRHLIKATRPKRIGGGTVSFVNSEEEWYLKETEHREEGGTLDSVGIIRLALAVKLKRTAGIENIARRNNEISRMFIKRLSSIPEVVLLGPPKVEKRHPVFSFLIRHSSSDLFFHYNYISALLNDLFGIQSRSGCMCAGPYAQSLLGISTEMSVQFLEALKESDDLNRTHLRREREYNNHEMLRPGFTRISIPYFWDDSRVEFVLSAIETVASKAADFLHLYQLNPESGEWHHYLQRTFHGRKWLGFVAFTPNGIKVDRPKTNPSLEFVSFEKMCQAATLLAEKAKQDLENKRVKVPDGRVAFSSEFVHLRWFVLPIEAIEGINHICPFSPKVFDDVEEEDKSSLYYSGKTNGITNGKLSEEEEEPIDLLPPSNASECLPCGSNTDIVCSLNVEGQQDGRLGDFGTDENKEEVKTQEDWNRRVIVKRRELTKEEEKQLPWVIPPLEMYKRVTEALHGLDMIREGDRVLVCLSGGKDSLSLLHILHFYRERCRKNKSTSFELGAITVDPGSTAYNPRPLIEYCQSLNIDYLYEEQDIISAARKIKDLRSICAFCSRMKRGRLAAAAQLFNWNVLAMGQHLDDLAESFFIACFQNGALSTMKAQYTTRDGSLRVIRPLVFVREKALREFAESNTLPVVAENCPACFNQATERHRMKQLLAQQELVFPDLFNSLRSALRPLLLVDSASTDQMRAKAIENIAKQNKGKAK